MLAVFTVLIALACWITCSWLLGWMINHISTKDIREYQERLDHNMRQVELERLKRLPTKSRIGRKPDL